MNTFEYLKTEQGFNAVQDILHAPLSNLKENILCRLDILRGIGVIRKSFAEARFPFSEVRLTEQEVWESIRALDIFTYTPTEDLTLYMGSEDSRVCELVELRLREGITHE